MINSEIGVKTINDTVYYFNGSMPIYQHHRNKYKSFRFITSQLIALNNAKQSEIIQAFKVSKESVKRWVKIYREKEEEGFFGTRKGRKGGNVLNEEMLVKVQERLNIGKMPKEIEDELGIKADTIRKAINSGRLSRLEIKTKPSTEEKTKSERSKQDSEAPLGVGCTNTVGRIDAVIKKK